VSGSVEAPRRHGAFDSRWPKRRLLVAADRPAPALTGLEDVPEGLDWDAFYAHSVPGRRRHNLEAISAYYAYKHGRQAAEEHRPAAQRRAHGLNEVLKPVRLTLGERSLPLAGGR
jgi:hypothetical protein